MKLYIKQRVFSWNDKFSVKNQFGEDVYQVEGELFSLGKRFHILDSQGREAAGVFQKLFTLFPSFEVRIGGSAAAEIVKKVTLFFQSYRVIGPDWEVEGSFWEHEYTITCRDNWVASVSKEWMTWGDSYVLEFDREEDALLVLGVVLAIDAVQEASRS